MEGYTVGCALKIGDRVVRKGIPGPIGTVKRVREETARVSLKDQDSEGAEPLGVTVLVLWDNGSLSHFVPDALEASAG